MSLPVFGVRELHGPSEHGLISITAPQYDSTIRSYPSSALTYIDTDDGETITVGSGLELQQRLDEPLQPKRPSRLRSGSMASNSEKDQKIHIFDIQRTSENLTVWRDHAAYSSKSPVTSPLPSLCHDEPMGLPTQIMSATTRGSPAPLPQQSSVQNEGAVPSQEPSKNILDNLDEVLQTACKGLETHIGGFASFLDMTAAALQAAAKKTRDADTTPVESLLNGLKNVLVEVGQAGMEVLREFDPQSQVSKAPPGVQVTDEKSQSLSSEKPESTLETESSTRKVSFASDQIQSPVSPIFSATFKRQEVPMFGTTPAIENLAASKASEPLKSMPYRSFPNRPAPPVCANPPQAPSKKDHSLMDEDSSNADFTARFPPLMSLKRARTIGALRTESTREEPNSTSGCTKTALTRYPSIGQLESRRAAAEVLNVRHWRRLSAIKSSSSHAQDLAKDRSLRGYRKPTVEDDSETKTSPVHVPTKSTVATGDVTEASTSALPGAWPERSTSAADPSFYESSGEFFDRMAAARSRKPSSPALSFRNTSPPADLFAPSTGGLRRAQTVTASNPAARLNGPFDPLNVAPSARNHSTVPQRSLTQHQPPRSQAIPVAPAIAPNHTTLWNNFNRQVPMLNAPRPPHAPFHRPAMPGAFPYPPVPQSQVQSVRHMRSEPNFGRQENVDVKVNDCVKTLRNMGYGMGNLYEGDRLPIYAGAASGDVLAAIDMIEEDRSAAKDMMV